MRRSWEGDVGDNKGRDGGGERGKGRMVVDPTKFWMKSTPLIVEPVKRSQ